MDITIKSGDTPYKLAKAYVGDGNKWPEFCKANPQFKSHPDYGCVFYAGNTAHLPATWPATQSGGPQAPIPGPVPQPVGPPVPTPGGEVIDLDAKEPGIFSGLDPKKIMIGGAAVAGLVVLVYAMKKKRPAHA